MTDLGDPGEVRDRSRKLRITEREKLSALSAFMASGPGREWMYDFLALARVFHSTFSSDPYVTAFQEGRRALGLALVAEVSKACPKFYVEMLAERLEKDTVDAARRE